MRGITRYVPSSAGRVRVQAQGRLAEELRVPENHPRKCLKRSKNMPCQGEKTTTSQKSEGGKKIEATSDIVKPIEKAPALRRKRMGWRIRGTSAEVKRKRSRNITQITKNANSRNENWWTKIMEMMRFQSHISEPGWVLKNRRKVKFNTAGTPNRKSIC
ncbi:hypothetical protein QQP08_006564 [Theobroma cacao]|nr:hypothetical protein QQP08_006564 [Theobroma cacao]